MSQTHTAGKVKDEDKEKSERAGKLLCEHDISQRRLKTLNFCVLRFRCFEQTDYREIPLEALRPAIGAVF